MDEPIFEETFAYRSSNGDLDGFGLHKVDAWIASSLFQKAVRRGDVETAISAAKRLFSLRGKTAFNRFVVAAFEDIGIGSEAAIVDTVAQVGFANCYTDGEYPSIEAVVRLLASAPKDRSADYLICAAHAHPSLEPIRRQIGGLNNLDRIAVAVNPSVPLPERAVAVWFAAGSNWKGEHRLGRGDPKLLLEAFRASGVSDALLNATSLAARITREPIVYMVPLLATALKTSTLTAVSQFNMPEKSTLYGIPLLALGHHTRVGKAAIRKFLRECAELRETVGLHVAEFKAASVVEIAVYYADAAPVSLKLVWDQSEALETLGRESDFLEAGAPIYAIAEIEAVVFRNLHHLNAIRSDLLRAALK